MAVKATCKKCRWENTGNPTSWRPLVLYCDKLCHKPMLHDADTMEVVREET
jgi:hypothetical protein